MKTFPAWLVATLASDAIAGEGILPNTVVHSLHSATHIAGPAYVAMMSHNDNLVIKQVLQAPPAPGSVLVVAGGSTSHTAVIGGLLARELQNAGIAGIITDGLIRDSSEIRELGLGVWCRGVTPAASQKHGPAVIGGSVSLGDTLIHDGDIVIADDDGVVIWPQERVDELLIKAEARLQQDNAKLAQLQQHS